MLLMNRARQRLMAFVLFFLVFALPLAALAAKPAPEPTLSPLATDLAALVTQGQDVDSQLAGINLTADNSCTELGGASTSVADWLAAFETVYAGMTTAFSVDTESLTSLDDLSNLAVTIGGRIESLSTDLNSISTVTDLVEYDASLAAMLTLSDDIGTMANRIGEMADRILIMADNIGLMADRILITQQLQSSNIVLTQNAILATQQNMVALSDTVSTLAYNPALASLVTQGNALSVSMDLVFLNQLNMGLETARIESEAALYLAQLNVLYEQVMNDSGFASQFINADTLTWAGDLTDIHRGLAVSLEGFAASIDQLAPLTSSSVLGNATANMLQLSLDIGTMSGRIMEMVDRIVVMADNIGAMTTRINDTQSLQQTNLEFTQASLLTATSTTVNVIATYGL